MSDNLFPDEEYVGLQLEHASQRARREDRLLCVIDPDHQMDFASLPENALAVVVNTEGLVVGIRSRDWKDD